MDWYQAHAVIGGEQRVLQVFAMRSMASGAAFHRAYFRATQQAFLEAHEEAFAYFGGVFRQLRFDNLASAVKRILRGHRREETTRFIAFRSHWGFASEFCNPAAGHEKGGVEGEARILPAQPLGCLFRKQPTCRNSMNGCCDSARRMKHGTSRGMS